MEVKSRNLKNNKARYKSFFASQKTLVSQSTEDSIEREEDLIINSQNMENNIPAIVEDLAKSDVEETYSFEKESGASLDSKGMDCLAINNDTTDEDVSELGPDDVDPILTQKRRKLRINLKNLSESEDEVEKNSSSKKDDCPTDESDVEVTQLDYYKIRHQNDKLSVPCPVSLPDECKDDTDESDVEVTEKDYYAIRHHAEKKDKTEFSLTWSPTQFRTICESKEDVGSFKIEKSRALLQLPQYPSVDIMDEEWMVDGKMLEDEEFPCDEEDFMTAEQFLKAHETNFELTEIGGNTSMTINPEIEPVESEDDTESIAESLSKSMFNEEDSSVGSEEVTRISEIDANEFMVDGKDGLKGVALMEHNDLQGTIAVYGSFQDDKCSIQQTNFKPELLEFKDEPRDVEAISEILNSQPQEKNPDDTDHSDLEDLSVGDTIALKPVPETQLPPPTRKLMLVHTHSDGGTSSFEHPLPEPVAKVKSLDVPTDDEQIEDFVASPVDDEAFDLIAPVAGDLSIVSTKIGPRERSKKKRNARRRVKMAIEVEVDDPVEEEL